MTPFFLNGKGPRAMQRELLANGHHHREHQQRDTRMLSTSTELGHRTRTVQPSPFEYTKNPSSYERLPPWFTSRSSRYPYSPDLSSTSTSAVEIAHRSLAHDLSNSDSPTYTRESERYSDRYITYHPDRQSEHPLFQKKKKKRNKADGAYVQQREDEFVFVRTRGHRDENGGWIKTEKEWVRERHWT